MADSVIIKITGDDTDFRKKMGNLGTIAKKGATAIGAAFVTAGAMGVKYNAQLESYQTSFEVMLGSVKKANDMMEELKKKAAATPFELTDIAEATQLLLNYGFTAEESLDTFSMLGDISQGNADKLQRVATAYGQMSSANKVSLEDVKQMIEAGFNPLQEISESTGESMASLYDRISKGTISVDEITASMQRSTSEGGKYFQSMDKQSQTLSGRFSTLKDNFNSTLGEVFKPVSNFIRDELIPNAIAFFESFDAGKAANAIVTLIKTIKNLLPIILTVVSAMAAWRTSLTITSIVRGLTTSVKGCWAALQLYSKHGQLATIATTGFTTGQKILTTVMGVATGKIKLATTAQKALTTAFKANPVGFIITAITVLIGVIVLLWNKCEWFRNAVGAMLDFFKAAFEGLRTALSAIWEAIKAVWDSIIPYLTAFWETVKAIFSIALDAIKGFFSAAWEGIKVVWDTVQPYFQALWDAIVFVFSVVAEILGGFFSAAWKAIKFIWDVVVNYFSDIWTGIKTVFDGIAAKFSKWFTAAKTAVTKVWDTIESYFSGILQDITDVFTGDNGIVAKFKTWFKEAYEKVKDFFTVDNFKEVFNNSIVGGLDGIVETVKTKAGDIWNSIQEAFKKTIKLFFGFGGAEGEGYATEGAGGALSPFKSGRISSAYGIRRKGGSVHTGIDFASPTGTPIQATTNGIVTKVANLGGKSYGKYVVVRDTQGFTHYYAHMSKQRAVVGMPVGRGMTIGYVGSTGNSTGPHLHYEVRRPGGGHTNPAPWWKGARGYATGGFPSPGELFIGNEDGIELMGKMGNKNVIANNMQIIEGIKQGLFSGMVNYARAKGKAAGNVTNIKQEMHFHKENESPSTVKRAARKGLKLELAGGY